MKKLTVVTAAVLGAALAPSVLTAQTLTVSTISSLWEYACATTGQCNNAPTNPTPHITFNNVNPNDVRLAWGVSANLPGTLGGQSQYSFQVTPTSFPVTLVGGKALFQVGLFTHINRYLRRDADVGGGSILDLADLRLNIGFLGSNPTLLSESFRFDHWETQNENTACPGGFPNPCPDEVVFVNTSTKKGFTVDGKYYTLRLTGFSNDGGNTLTNQFWSREDGNNSTFLYAEIVPEPSSLALLGTGVFMLGVMVRSRKRNVA